MGVYQALATTLTPPAPPLRLLLSLRALLQGLQAPAPLSQRRGQLGLQFLHPVADVVVGIPAHLAAALARLGQEPVRLSGRPSRHLMVVGQPVGTLLRRKHGLL